MTTPNRLTSLMRATMLFVLLSFVSCSDQDIATVDEYVSFEIADSDDWTQLTRGAELTIDELRKGFGVFAFYTEDDSWAVAQATSPNFMNNQKVTGTAGESGTVWGYSPLKYWPNNPDDKVSFFAYAPYIESQTAVGSKLPFKVATDVDNQVDLSWSTSNTTDLDRNTKKVTFNFNHALARIGFTVKMSEEGSNTLPKDVKIIVEEVSVGKFYSEGKLDLSANTATWSDMNAEQMFSIDADNFVGENADGFVLTKDNTTSALKLNKDDSYIMVIPRDYSITECDVVVKYKVVLSNALGKYHEYTNECKGVAKIDFQAGKTHILNITTDIKKITIDSVYVTPWESGGDIYIGGIVQ